MFHHNPKVWEFHETDLLLISSSLNVVFHLIFVTESFHLDFYEMYGFSLSLDFLSSKPKLLNYNLEHVLIVLKVFLTIKLKSY